MSDIDVSVIVPVYNAQPFVETLLESLSASRLQRIEFLVVDDGSTDGSGAVCDFHARRDDRFRVIRRRNGGPSSARNTALAVARGSWIAFADGDDWFAPGAIETWLKAAQEQKLDVLVGNAFRFSDKVPAPDARVPMLVAQPWRRILPGADWIVHAVANAEWPHFVPLQLVRRELIGDLTFREGLVHEDVLWTLALALRAQRVGFDPVPRYGYRINPASISTAPAQAAVVRRANAYLQIVDVIADVAAAPGMRPDLRRALRRHAHQEMRHLFGLIRKRISDSPERVHLVECTLQPSKIYMLFVGIHSTRSLWFALRTTATLLALKARNRLNKVSVSSRFKEKIT